MQRKVRPPEPPQDTGGPVSEEEAVRAIRAWVETLVIGLNLCPFARSALQRDRVEFEVIDTISVRDALQQFADAASRLVEDEQSDRTVLLILPDGFVDFDDYLDLLGLAEALLEDLGYTGHLQIASFHPDYRFADTPTEDAANWTNRAPFPVLQLLREDSVSRAVDLHADPEGIPARNIERLRSLGTEGLHQLLAPRAEDTIVH